MIYFDNAATSFFKPQEVIESFLSGVTKFSVNPNRSFNPLTKELSYKIFDTRKKIATFVGLNKPENVVFGLNCTDALNLAILGSIQKHGEHIISSVLEHNSVLRPLCRLKERNFIDLTFLTPNANMQIYCNAIEDSIKPNTTMIVLSHVSNVVGATQNLSQIGNLCKKRGIKFVVDAAQSIGYSTINMKESNINLLAFPAHKGLHSTVGCGVLCFDDKSKPKPIRYGGTGTQSHLLSQPTESPEAYESGTINTPAILALSSALDWWQTSHTKKLKQLNLIQRTIFDGLKDIKNIDIMSVANTSGIVTFLIKNFDSTLVADILANNYGIAVRGGLHCAPLCHKFLRTTETGLIRVSCSGENSLSEAYIFLNAIDQLSKQNTI